MLGAISQTFQDPVVTKIILLVLIVVVCVAANELSDRKEG